MMRKFFCKNDADDFEDLPAFNEDKVSLTMMIAGAEAAQKLRARRVLFCRIVLGVFRDGVRIVYAEIDARTL